jgi:hypothetical protein
VRTSNPTIVGIILLKWGRCHAETLTTPRTDHRVVEFSTPVSYSKDPRFVRQVRRQAILTKDIRDFSHSLRKSRDSNLENATRAFFQIISTYAVNKVSLNMSKKHLKSGNEINSTNAHNTIWDMQAMIGWVKTWDRLPSLSAGWQDDVRDARFLEKIKHNEVSCSCTHSGMSHWHDAAVKRKQSSDQIISHTGRLQPKCHARDTWMWTDEMRLQCKCVYILRRANHLPKYCSFHVKISLIGLQ